jgi:hypothetical protein
MAGFYQITAVYPYQSSLHQYFDSSTTFPATLEDKTSPEFVISWSLTVPSHTTQHLGELKARKDFI